MKSVKVMKQIRSDSKIPNTFVARACAHTHAHTLSHTHIISNTSAHAHSQTRIHARTLTHLYIHARTHILSHTVSLIHTRTCQWYLHTITEVNLYNTIFFHRYNCILHSSPVLAAKTRQQKHVYKSFFLRQGSNRSSDRSFFSLNLNRTVSSKT